MGDALGVMDSESIQFALYAIWYGFSRVYHQTYCESWLRKNNQGSPREARSLVNFLWLAMLLCGVAAAAGNGAIEGATAAAMEGAAQSIAVIIEIAAVMMLWMGLLACAEKSGLVDLLARLVRPLAKRLFPSVPPDHPAMGAIVMNISANLLGLGNAATPFGLKAMTELQKLNPKPDTATDDMITFLVLNTSAVTLIPALVISLRIGAGSAAPEEIVGATVLATLTGTVTGLLAHRLLKRVSR